MEDRYTSTVTVLLPGGRKALVAFDKDAEGESPSGIKGRWYVEIEGKREFVEPSTLLRAVQMAYSKLEMPLIP